MERTGLKRIEYKVSANCNTNKQAEVGNSRLYHYPYLATLR